MSRTFTIKELNEKIDELLSEWNQQYVEVRYQNDCTDKLILIAKIEGLEELKAELNNPEPIVNVTEKIQESLNIIETNKIIKNGL